jgi:uncharacterized protein
MEIPLFPLHTVLCPGIVLPLHVFEERYRILVERCLDDGSGFGVVRIREGREVGPVPAALEQVGTMARPTRVTRLPDGRFDLLVVGAQRFRIDAVAADREPYLVADGRLLDEPLGDPEQVPALVEQLGRGLVRLLAALSPGDRPEGGGSPDEVARRLAEVEDPTALSHLLAGLVPVEPAVRHGLLEATTTEARLVALERVLARETMLLEHRLAAWPVDPREDAGRTN